MHIPHEKKWNVICKTCSDESSAYERFYRMNKSTSAGSRAMAKILALGNGFDIDYVPGQDEGEQLQVRY